jgi:hypothetical protein
MAAWAGPDVDLMDLAATPVPLPRERNSLFNMGLPLFFPPVDARCSLIDVGGFAGEFRGIWQGLLGGGR